MPSPIDCSSTGASSGSSSPVSDGLDGRRPATGTAVHETQAHDGLDREEHGSDEYGSEEVGSEEVGSEEVTDEEDIDGETTDEHADAEIADDGGVGYEQVEVGLLPRDDNARRDRRDRRDRRFCLLTLISCLFALAAVMYSAREPLPAYLAEPPQVPAWLANLRPARPKRLVPLDAAESVQAIVELYEPFLLSQVGLLAARPWRPISIISDLSMSHLPEGAYNKVGGAFGFFFHLERNVSELCGTIQIAINTIPAGDPWRPNEELEGLCRPLIHMSRAAVSAYGDVAHSLAGPPHRGTRWLEQLLREVLALAHAAAGPDGPGHNLEGAADYLAANASTSDRLRRQQGSWQHMNSYIKEELWRMHLTCWEVERMWVKLAPVARWYIARKMATAAGDAGPGSLHAQVTGDLLQLESAITVVRELTLASLDSIEAMIMAQQRLQELYDLLGCVKQACLVKRDGDEAMERFVLADPSVLHEKLIGTADWLQARMEAAEDDGFAQDDSMYVTPVMFPIRPSGRRSKEKWGWGEPPRRVFRYWVLKWRNAVAWLRDGGPWGR
ncbi:hypothetical protein F5883DRAFT_98948 [Diaporthe sp. PMI_573]|nr:hypothetical protein F5883DRAFT_98948 [Diaporthaceae sp. PMI_573]